MRVEGPVAAEAAEIRDGHDGHAGPGEQRAGAFQPDVEDFVATVEKILQLCDVWAERIKEKSSGAADVFRADDHHPSFFRINP